MGALVLAALAVALVLGSRPPEPQNPVHAGDFPDPFVVHAGGSYYAYATNASDNVQLLGSPDLARWERLPDALPRLPSWAAPGRTWAPSALEREGRWILYFSARHAETGRQCIGAARGAGPAGPFADDSPAPLVCSPQSDVGAIDASPFVDRDGAAYLLWAQCCAPAARIVAQRLSADGLRLEGTAQAVIGVDQEWEGRIVEAPSMLLEGDRYYLLYSANRWQDERYAVGLAECAGPLGPCRKPLAGPLLASEDGMAGPGGQEFFRDRRGAPWIAYHAWTPPLSSYASGGARSLRLERVEIRDGALGLGGRSASADRRRPDSAAASPADRERTPR